MLAMRRIDKFLYMLALEKRLLFQTALVLAAFRLGLWLAPFWMLRRAAERSMRRLRCESGDETVISVASRITQTSRYIPGATCLPQALAAQVLLRHAGFRPKLRIGVAKADDGNLKAHAWVECRGKTVIGAIPGQVFSIMNE